MTQLTRKKVTQTDVARALGVTTATVSRALNDLPNVPAARKAEIWKTARDMGYRFRPGMPASLESAEALLSIIIPTPQGRGLSRGNGRGGTGWLGDPFYQDLIGGVAAAAREKDVDILVSHGSPTSYSDLSRQMETSRTDGTIVLGQSILHDALNRIADGGSKFVVWGAELAGQDYATVGTDNRRGGARATRHIANQGAKRIAFLGDIRAPEINLRHAGYRQGVEESGLAFDPDLTISVRFEMEDAEARIAAMIQTGPLPFDAIFAASDIIALGAMRALQAAGLRVPGDVCVVGYDDIRMSEYAGLTTVRQDLEEAGRLMVTKLLHAGTAADIRSQRLGTDLVVRETCGL